MPYRPVLSWAMLEDKNGGGGGGVCAPGLGCQGVLASLSAFVANPPTRHARTNPGLGPPVVLHVAWIAWPGRVRATHPRKYVQRDARARAEPRDTACRRCRECCHWASALKIARGWRLGLLPLWSSEHGFFIAGISGSFCRVRRSDISRRIPGCGRVQSCQHTQPRTTYSAGGCQATWCNIDSLLGGAQSSDWRQCSRHTQQHRCDVVGRRSCNRAMEAHAGRGCRLFALIANTCPATTIP